MILDATFNQQDLDFYESEKSHIDLACKFAIRHLNDWDCDSIYLLAKLESKKQELQALREHAAKSESWQYKTARWKYERLQALFGKGKLNAEKDPFRVLGKLAYKSEAGAKFVMKLSDKLYEDYVKWVEDLNKTRLEILAELNFEDQA